MNSRARPQLPASAFPIADEGYAQFYEDTSSAPQANLAERRSRELDKLRIRNKYQQRDRERLLRIYQQALDEAVRREALGSSRIVSFKVKYNTHFGQELFIIGSTDSMAAWTPSKAVKLTWEDGNYWVASVQIQSSESSVEYKYLIMDKGQIEWEAGKNHVADLSKSKGPVQLVDSWGGSW